MPFVGSIRGNYGLRKQPFPISDGKLSVSSSGGSVVTMGGYRIHTFTGGTSSFVAAVSEGVGGNGSIRSNGALNTGAGGGNQAYVEYLVVGGGGGGGARHGGGGGAGGLVLSAGAIVTNGQSYTVTVGGGGGGGQNDSAGGQGQNSSFSTVTAIGGGGGGTWSNQQAGNAGGSSGGNSGDNPNPNSPQQTNQDLGGIGYGNRGGVCQSSNHAAGAGGGGAGAPHLRILLEMAA